MKKQYFGECASVQETKTLYRQLAFENHPDTGGSTATMQEINNQYHRKLKNFDGSSFMGFDEKEHYYRYNHDVEQELMDKINELLAFQFDGVLIELVGTWIWVHGETKPYKEELKKAKCKWHSKRHMWYYRRFEYKRKYSGVGFDTLRAMYGSNVYEKEEEDNKTALSA